MLQTSTNGCITTARGARRARGKQFAQPISRLKMSVNRAHWRAPRPPTMPVDIGPGGINRLLTHPSRISRTQREARP